MIQQALEYVGNFKMKIANLKKKSPIYPDILFTISENEVFLTTLVHFQHKAVWYARHHVESGILTDTFSIEMIFNRLNQEASKTKTLGIPCEFDELIGQF